MRSFCKRLHSYCLRFDVEMMKAGLIEEMVNDVMEDVSDAQEEEVDEEVAKVLQEVAGDVIEKLPDAGRVKVEPEKTEEVRVQPWCMHGVY